MFCHVNIIVKNLIMLKIELQLIFNTLLVIKFVKSTADRGGYFSQIKESLLILGKELVYNTESVDITMVDAVISSSNNELDHSNLDLQPRKKTKYDAFSWFQTNEASTISPKDQSLNINSQIEEEIQMYISEMTPMMDKYFLLNWWKQHKTRYPLLSNIAMRIFVIQGSSAESERHFSAFNARNIINYQRNSMLPETVEAVSVVLEGYKNSIIS